MLTELSIRDIALIPRLHIRFGRGLNVLSGETGAGKSLVVGSLRLLCGDRAPPGFVRQGASRGIVEGIFEIDPSGWIAKELSGLGIEVEDGELILRREIAAEGKGRVRANGEAIPLRTLAAASELLIDLHGQHDHQSLLKPSYQLTALDECGGLLDARDQFATLHGQWRAARTEWENARRAFHEDHERTELARFQLRELEEAQAQPGERATLTAERGRLEQAEFLREASARIVDGISESEGSVHDVLAELAAAAESSAAHDPGWKSVARGLSRLTIDADELAREARSLGELAVDDPERLGWVRERVRLLEDLLRKYGPHEADLFAFRDRLRELDADPEARERRLAALEEQLVSISDKLVDHGNRLGRKRKTAARKLRKAVEGALGALGMEGTSFDAVVEPRAAGDRVAGEDSPLRAGRSGLDQVEFRLAANRGEDLRPLRHVASGGEISRVMLALKSVVGTARGTATMVFDEIDSGVGGTVAARVAGVLQRIAEGRQVLCITHLPAIAAVASVQLRVSKAEEDGRTVTSVDPVDGEIRVHEIARMLGGTDEVGAAVSHARELLKERT